MPEIKIAPLQDSPQIRVALCDMLIEAVADGASVSFLYPLSREDADSFWEASLAAAAKGERIVLGAFDGGILTGTFTLVLNLPPNQPHRGELAKLIIRISHRGQALQKLLALLQSP